jgi:hypothetical protein
MYLVFPAVYSNITMAKVFAKVSPNQYLLLNPSFSLVGVMFKFQTEEPAEFYKLNVTPKHYRDDKLFGEMYAVIGCFQEKNSSMSGFLVVVHSTVDLVEEHVSIVNDSGVVLDEVPGLDRAHSLHLVCFGKLVLNKIRKRTCQIISSLNFTNQALSGHYIMSLFKVPLFFHPEQSSKATINQIECNWIRLFQNVEDITESYIDTTNKRSHVLVVTSELANQLIESADLSPLHGCQVAKKMKTIRREVTDVAYSKIFEHKKSMKDMINLREESISLFDGSFNHRCEAEQFSIGYLKMKGLCLSDTQSAATAASVLMDPFYRIDDCKELNENVIAKVGIDVDQVIIVQNY